MKSELTAGRLPPNVDRVLSKFVEEACEAFGEDLRSVVLYGSGAEGKLRETSDVNTLLVLNAFRKESADRLQEPLRAAGAAVRLRAMFLLESELRPAMAAFAVKFADISRRRRILYGEDPFVGLNVTREDAIARLKQTLLNLTLRLREAYIARGLREEQLVQLIADAAGPLRSCAVTLLELEGSRAESPKDALQQVAARLVDGQSRLSEVSLISEAREKRALAPGTAAATLFQLIELARSMWTRAASLS